MEESSGGATFICPYCTVTEFSSPSETLLLSHVRLVHSMDPDFQIQCSKDGCSRTFNNFRTYQNHLLTHRSINLPEEREYSGRVDSDNIDEDFMFHNDDLPSEEVIQSFSAKWILKTSETRSLTRAATTGIVADVADMVNHVAKSLEVQTRRILNSTEIDASILDGIFKGPVTRPFEGLHSFCNQIDYYRKHFNLIEPERIVLKETSSFRLCGRRRKVVVKKTEIIYVSLLKTIERQLQNASTLLDVDHIHYEQQAQYLGDFCDGRQFQQHPLFAASPSSLQIVLYYDELEVCNPLGSRKKKHKLGAFYYVLGNIKPHKRSKLSQIQLLLLAKYQTISEFGIDKILEPIVNDIKKLESDDGYPFIINGEVRTFRGTVSVVSADNPASALLGGFKQSASAFRYCRHCTGTDEEIQKKFVESNFQLRTPAKHSDHCDLVEQEDLSSLDQHHYSTTFGVNRRALLNSLRYFDVTSGALIPDIMHDLLEGVLPLELKCMLKVFVIEKKLFTLKYVDEQFSSLNIRSFDGDKPSPIASVSLTTVDSNLHQHAIQMWTMGRFFPFILGDKVSPEDKYSRTSIIRTPLSLNLFCVFG